MYQQEKNNPTICQQLLRPNIKRQNILWCCITTTGEWNTQTTLRTIVAKATPAEPWLVV